MIGSDGRGVVIAESSQPFVIQQLSRLCHSTENEPAVLESIKASIVVQWRRNAGHTLSLRPGDIRLSDFAGAAGADSHEPIPVLRVELSGLIGVPFFSGLFQNNVRRGQEQQTASDDRRTFAARRQSCYPPSLRSSRKIVCHQALVGPKVTSQYDNFVVPVVTPMHGSGPSVLH